MFQFTYKLKVSERVKAKCDQHQARQALYAAHHEFPWFRSWSFRVARLPVAATKGRLSSETEMNDYANTYKGHYGKNRPLPPSVAPA